MPFQLTVSSAKEVSNNNNKRKIPDVERIVPNSLCCCISYRNGILKTGFLYEWVVCSDRNTTKSANDAIIFTSIAYLTLNRAVLENVLSRVL